MLNAKHVHASIIDVAGASSCCVSQYGSQVVLAQWDISWAKADVNNADAVSLANACPL